MKELWRFFFNQWDSRTWPITDLVAAFRTSLEFNGSTNCKKRLDKMSFHVSGDLVVTQAEVRLGSFLQHQRWIFCQKFATQRWTFCQKILFFPAIERIVQKFPHIFHFQKWKIVQNCTTLGKNLIDSQFWRKKCKKISP